MESVVRPTPVTSHPMLTKQYIIATPAINAAYREVRRIVSLQIPGAIMFARSRFGKTWAIRYMRVALREDLEDVVIHSFRCKKVKTPSESAFHEDLLFAVGHENWESGSGSKKKRRLMNYLIDEVGTSNQGKLILFADEAQRLTVTEYEWLKDIHDELDENGYRMITLSVGQPELLSQKGSFRTSKKTHLVMRFMVDEIEFHGLTSMADLKDCLEKYDESCYPSGSDWTFTRYFFPLAFLDGMRVANCAEELWEAFKVAHIKSGVREELEIPMQYFSSVVETVFSSYFKLDRSDFRISQEMWNQAIEYSGFAHGVSEYSLIQADDSE